MLRGFMLDIDGTLVLSNDAHARSWVEAFARFGYEVSFDEVLRLIGMGGDKLISTIRPDLTEAEGDGKKILEVRSRIFLESYAPHLQPTKGSRELVAALQSRGLKTIAASSAKSDELEALLKAAKVDDLLTEATTSDDADNSKPDPDIVQIAMQKLELNAEDVMMIGDTPYDIEAAEKAGVGCIAVRTGGWKDEDLADAVAIYDDPADLLSHLDEY